MSRNSVELPKLNNVATEVVQPTRNMKATQPRVTETPSRNVARSQSAENLKMTLPDEADIPIKSDANNAQRAESQTAQVTNDSQQKSAVRQETKMADLPKTQVAPVQNQIAQTKAKETPLEMSKNTLAPQERTAIGTQPRGFKTHSNACPAADSQPVNGNRRVGNTDVAKVPTPAVNPRSQRVLRDVPRVQAVETPQTAVVEAPAQVEPRTNAVTQRANTANTQASPSKAPSENVSSMVTAEAVNRQNSREPNPQMTAASSRPSRRSRN